MAKSKKKSSKRRWFTVINGSVLRVRSTTHFGACQKFRAMTANG